MAGFRAWAVLLLVVGAFVVLASGSLFGDKSAGEHFQEGAETAGHKAGEVVKEGQRQVEDATEQTQENAKSWGEWTKEKLTSLTNTATEEAGEQYGTAKETADQAASGIASKTGETLTKGKDTITEKVSVYFKKWASVAKKNFESYRKGSTPDIRQVVDETKETGSEAADKTKAAADKTKETAEAAATKTKETGEQTKRGADDLVEKAKQAWEAARGKSGEGAEEARRKYEEAKERASKTTGDVGEQIGEKTGVKEEL